MLGSFEDSAKVKNSLQRLRVVVVVFAGDWRRGKLATGASLGRDVVVLSISSSS